MRCLVVVTMGGREPSIDLRPLVAQASVAVIDWTYPTTFDLGPYCYVPGKTLFRVDHSTSPIRGGFKWNNIRTFFELYPWTLDQIDWVWFPEDDLELPLDCLPNLVAEAEANRLRLCQPAIEGDCWEIARRRVQSEGPTFAVRRTTMVEQMCPLMRIDTLKTLLPSFTLCESGYGLEAVWGSFLNYEGIGIVDSVVVKHCRRHTSYRSWKLKCGLTPMEEGARLMETMNLKERRPRELP